jgi:protein disulfide-isomerase A1
LAPIYDELGASIKSENIVIAKVDATTNDTPIDVKGFPTLILFKAESNEQVTFDGDRTLIGLQEFLKKNAVHGDEIEISQAEEKAEEDEGHAEL